MEPLRNLTRATVLAERVEVASSLWARFMGLMGRAALPDGDALWLPGTNGIHMLFMRFPIDCVFLAPPSSDGEREVVAVGHDLAPWTGVVWFVRGADGVVELPAGTLARTATVRGDRLMLAAPMRTAGG